MGVQFGAYAGPAGIVVGAVLGFATDALFGGFEGERIYHNETLSHVVQENEDGSKVVIGLREAGALLKTDDNYDPAIEGANDVIGTVSRDRDWETAK